MRSLSSAFSNRHDQEDAASHRPVGGGCRDGHAGCPPGRGERGHAASDQAAACEHDPPGAGPGRGGHRVRPGGPGRVRHHADRDGRKAADVRGRGGLPEGDLTPAARTLPRTRQIARSRQDPGERQGAAAGRGAHRQRAFGPAAQPDERVHAGRPDRRAQGPPRARDARRPAHPGNPADRRPAAGLRSACLSLRSACLRRARLRSPGRRLGPGSAFVRVGQNSATAPWSPARDAPGRPGPGVVCTRRPASAVHAAPGAHAPPGHAAARPRDAAARAGSAA